MRTLLVAAGLGVASLALLGARVDPTPAPASTQPTPLKEIGRVRTSVCATIVVHANSAIDDALTNDADTHSLIVQLATAHIADGTLLSKHNTLKSLSDLAVKLRESALAGEAEIRRLRTLADDSPEPRKSELKAFADALGGALYRQRIIAIDTQRLVAVQQGREEAANQGQYAIGFGPNMRSSPSPDPVQQMNGPGDADYDRAFKAIAADFTDRTKLVAIDEGVAADHGLGATTGC